MAVMTAADMPPPARAGSIVNWAELLAAHEAWLKRVIAARTGQSQSADEVWQQVALAAVEQRWPLTDATKAGPWLHRLAVIASARYRRQLGRGRRALAGWADLRLHASRLPADPLSWLMRKERVALAREALARLDGRDVEVLVLKYQDRWSYRQIAAQLGISEKAVDCRLLRARERLRQELAALGLKGEEE